MWSGYPTPSPAVSAGAPPMSFKLHARIARADNMTQRHTDTHDMTDTPCRGFAITAIRKITSCCSGFAIRVSCCADLQSASSHYYGLGRNMADLYDADCKSA